MDRYLDLGSPVAASQVTERLPAGVLRFVATNHFQSHPNGLQRLALVVAD
jgi:hypothetical protein